MTINAADIRRVRRLIGDTDDTDYLLQDVDIEDYLTDYGNVYAAAAMACDGLAARFAREVDVSIDSGALSLKNSALYSQYLALAKSIRVQMLTIGGNFSPYAGGVVVADGEANRDNTSLVQPIFKRDQT